MDTQTILLIVQGAALAALLLVFALKRPNRRPALPAASVKNSDRELQKLRRLRENRLTEPLSERTRPRSFDDIVGQEEGIAALKAALCGPNPQHVIIYGPPGVGKTCAARLVLEYAKTTKGSALSKKRRVRGSGRHLCALRRALHRRPLARLGARPHLPGCGRHGNAGIPQPKAGRGHARLGRGAVFGRDRRTAPRAAQQAPKGARRPQGHVRKRLLFPGRRRHSPLHPRHFQKRHAGRFPAGGGHHQVPARHPRSHPLPLHRALFKPLKTAHLGGHRPQRRRAGRHGHRAGGGKKGRQLLLFGAGGQQPHPARRGIGHAGRARGHHRGRHRLGGRRLPLPARAWSAACPKSPPWGAPTAWPSWATTPAC